MPPPVQAAAAAIAAAAGLAGGAYATYRCGCCGQRRRRDAAAADASNGSGDPYGTASPTPMSPLAPLSCALSGEEDERFGGGGGGGGGAHNLSALEGGLLQWRDKRIGLSVRFDPAVMKLQLPVHRCDPFAVMIFEMAGEQVGGDAGVGAAVTVQVHNVSGEPQADLSNYLELYVERSLEDLEEMDDELLEVEPRRPTTLDGLPALHFHYCCVDGDGVKRKVYSLVAQREGTVFSVSYSSPKDVFSSMETVRSFARDVRIRAPEASESVLVFTDPKYSVSMQVSASEYYVESTAAEGGSSWREVVQFSSAGKEGATGGASILRMEAEPADLPVIDMEGVSQAPLASGSAVQALPLPQQQRAAAAAAARHKSAASALHYAAQLYRQQVQGDPSCPEGSILWTRLDVEDAHGGALVPTERGRRASADIFNSLARTLTLRGPEELDAIAFSYNKLCGDTTLGFVVYMWMVKGDLFVLSSVCDLEERVSVAKAMWTVANTVRYGEKHGQTASLQYYTPVHQFSLSIPTGMRAFEPIVGDPFVVLCLPAGSKLLQRGDEKAHDKKARLSREFYVQVRVQEDVEADQGLEETLVHELGTLAGMDASVHSHRVTQLAGHIAIEITFSAHNQPVVGCAELAMPPPGQATTLRMIVLRDTVRYTLELIASVNYFPILSVGVFADVLHSFNFDFRPPR